MAGDKEIVSFGQLIKRFQEPHVAVEVDTTPFVQNIKPQQIGKLRSRICLASTFRADSRQAASDPAKP